MAIVINICNNTVRTEFDNQFTPQEFQDEIELEYYFITRRIRKANAVDELRSQHGLKGFVEGNELYTIQ
jgi:hypothetical protein